ncbi:Rha family transcriptional regulator [Metaclostridioides mangenotii]|uniref:Rha family transcriptional regulator n=1 Tax=Metaclostridioides mangenotii TaxID=1540 RepID=UPI0026F27838|nr:phage regulatory protein/antirepressor Ant [Clostridioides mangenotii]
MLKIEKKLSSREVAEMVGKDHDQLLRSIRTYEDYLDSAKLQTQEYFIKNTYLSSQNKELPCYLITKVGCDMIANKLTGKKGVIFTAKYVKRFNEMEEVLKSNQPQLPANYIEALESLVESEKEKEQLKLENKEQEQKLLEVQPKAERWAAFLNSEGLSTIDDFSKAIAIKDLGRNNMYSYLRSKGLLRQDNSPYQAYIEQGLMIKRQSGCYVYRGSLESSYKTYLTNKGIDKIITLLNKDGYMQIN